MKRLYLFLCCVGAFGLANAQQESTLNSMRNLPQATYTNPAIVPIQSLYLGLPGISSVAGYGSSNSLNYNDVQDIGLEGEAENFSSNRLLSLRNKLEDKNWIAAGAQTDLLGLGFRAGPRLYFRYRASLKVNQRSMMPGDILLLADPAFLNIQSRAQLSTSVNLIAYLENSLGASYLINPQFTVGANIKRLNGMATLQTEQMDFQLSSDPNQKLLTLKGEMLAYSSGYELLQEPDDLSAQEIRNKLGGNGGWAIDLGAIYQVSPRLQLGLSVLDLGAISWSGDAKEHRINGSSITFESLNASNDEVEQERYEDFVDALNENFEPAEKDIEKFRTGLPTRMYLTTSYELYRNVQASGIFFSEIYKGRYLPGFTAALHKDFGRILGLSLSYTAINNSYANFGTGFSLNLTPFQLYVVTDNALATLDWEDAKNVNVRAGLNLVFGHIKKPSKLPY